MRQLKNLFTTITNSFSNKKLSIFVFTMYVFVSCSYPISSRRQEQATFHAYEWISDYYKYHWDLPDSIEQLIAFGEGFVAKFWNEPYCEQHETQSWLWLYKYCKNNPQSFVLFRHGDYIVMIDYVDRWYVGIEQSFCEELRNVDAYRFKDVVLGRNQAVLYDLIDVLQQEKTSLIKTLASVYEHENIQYIDSEIIACSYDKSKQELELFCSVDNEQAFALVKEPIKDFAAAFIKNHPEVYTLRFFIRIPIR